MTRAPIAEPSFARVYGLAHFGKSLFWQSSEVLFIFFLTEVCAIPARQAGLVLGAALAFSAVADLAVARGLSRAIASSLVAARWQLRGTVLCSLALLLFAWTGSAPPDHRLAFALTASLLFRAAYALTDVPQNALLSLLAVDEDERTRLSSARFVAGGWAALVVSGLAALLIQAVRTQHGAGLVAAGVLGLDLVAVFSAALLFVGTKRAAPARRDPVRSTMSFRASLVAGPVPGLLAMGLVLAATAPVFSKLEPYFAAYVLNSASAGGLMLAAGSIGGVVSQALWTPLSHRIPRRRVMAIAAILVTFGAAAFFGLASSSAVAAMIGAFLVGAGLGGLGMATWAALADASASLGSPAAVFGGFTFASKLGLAVSTVVVSEALAAHDYGSVPSQGAWPLLSLMGLAPVVGALAYLTFALVRERVPL